MEGCFQRHFIYQAAVIEKKYISAIPNAQNVIKRFDQLLHDIIIVGSMTFQTLKRRFLC